MKAMCGSGESEAANSYSVRHSFRHSKLNPLTQLLFSVSAPYTAWSEPTARRSHPAGTRVHVNTSSRESCKSPPDSRWAEDTSLHQFPPGREFLGPTSVVTASGAATVVLARSHKDFVPGVKGFLWLCFLELRYFWHQCL